MSTGRMPPRHFDGGDHEVLWRREHTLSDDTRRRYCLHCEQDEGAWSTHCPGYSTAMSFDRAVERGEADFIEGEMVEGVLAIAAARAARNAR